MDVVLSPENCVSTLKIRRSRLTSISIADSPHLDLKKFLSGSWHIDQLPALCAFSPVSSQIVRLESEDVAFLMGLSGTEFCDLKDVVPSGPKGEARLKRLTESGIVLTDADTDPDRKFREFEETMIDIGWNLAAANYHCSAKWTDTYPDKDGDEHVRGKSASENLFERIARQFGPPPSHFFSVPRKNTIELPMVNRDDGVFGDLLNRQSVRNFDASRPVSREVLATVLYHVFGCTGYGQLSDDLVVLKKCSPSGGSLHETEAYLLLANVEDVATGLYHYNVENHSLDELELMTRTEAHSFATLITAGQNYLATAPVLIVLVSRYDRLFWKYRDHQKAYKVSLMDAAHLSQTIYLVCTALGIGACFTGAVRDTIIEAKLLLDPARHGVAGVSAFGWADTQDDVRMFKPTPYIPRTTKI